MKIMRKQIELICKRLNIDLICFEFLGRGNNNENFVINTQQDRFVLRIENNSQFKNIKKEFVFLAQTNGKFGPRVFLFDSSRKIIPKDYFVEEFIEGEHPKKIDDVFIKVMAKWYRELHKNKGRNKNYLDQKDEFDLMKSFRSHGFSTYQKYKHILNKEYFDILERIYNHAICVIKENDNLFSGCRNLSLNHGDPTSTNIFYVDGEIKLIDWEFVRYDLPEFDIAFFCWSYNLNKNKKDLFLKTYEFSKSDKSNRRLNIIEMMHILGMIAWRVERLYLIHKKKLCTGTSCLTKKEIYLETKKDLKKVDRLLKILR